MTTNSSSRAAKVAANYQRVLDCVAEAAQRAGRPPEAVRVVGVSKYVDAAATRLLIDAGCRDLGESRPQALAAKAADPALAGRATWHLIGHLQRNKVGITLACDPLIHSVDSPRLLAAINTEAARRGATARVLLEVNCSGDESKDGLRPDDLARVLDALAEHAHVQVAGLMTMAALEGGIDVARRNFAQLRELRDAATTTHPHLTLTELSMGMSDDFPAAIAEGATLIRVGSLLWEGLPH